MAGRPSSSDAARWAAASAGLLLLVAGCVPSEPSGPWELVWEDDFEGAEGSSPDPARWTFDEGSHGWGNNELQDYTRDNAALDGDGNLRIEVRREASGGAAYTSARLKTEGLFASGPASTFKARIRVPQGRGIWPAFWMLGENFEEVGWPDCGEIDILEIRGSNPGKVVQTVHGPGYSGASGVGVEYRAPEGDFADGFHTYAAVLEEDRIWWYVDDVLTHSLTRSDLEADGREWVFDHGFFVILNVAVGGHFVLPPTDATVLPVSMDVDYVRVWQRPEE